MDWVSATGAGDEASAAASRSSALRRRGSREKERRRRAAARVALSALTVGTQIEILRGTRQIQVDAARAFHWIECIRWPSNERALRVAALERVLGRVFMANGGGSSLSTTLAAPFYIQGAHDVGALLLLELGEARAGPVLHGLTNGLMRGFFSHDDIEQPLALLSLIPPALKALNPALSRALFPVLEMNGGVNFGGPTLATLPWVLTWFTHASPARAPAAALFNGLLAIQHPLAPVYAAAALIASPQGLIALSKALGPPPRLTSSNPHQHQHASLFTAINTAQEGELHAALSGLPASVLTSKSDGIALAISATALTCLLPPKALLALAPQNTQNILRERWPELWNEIRCVSDGDGGGSGGSAVQEDDFVANSGSVTIGTYAATLAAALVTLLVAWTAMKQQ